MKFTKETAQRIPDDETNRYWPRVMYITSLSDSGRGYLGYGYPKMNVKDRLNDWGYAMSQGYTGDFGIYTNLDDGFINEVADYLEAPLVDSVW